MKILLHMGLHKTGTTSLQTALFNAREELKVRGVLYPDGGAARENHKLLTALYKDPDRVSFSVKYLYGDDVARMRRAATEMFEAIKRDVAQHRPKRLVLSSEFFFADPRAEEQTRFRALLEQLSDDIEPIVYFREPAVHYGSTLQQSVKNGREFEPVPGGRFQRDAAIVEAAFGQPITACVADRDQLIGGSTLTDFVSRFLTPFAGPVSLTGDPLNESISAEALAILHRYRRFRYPEVRPGQMPDHHALRTVLERIEAASPRPPSLQLKPGVAQALRRASTDLLWLRDSHGIVFTGVDYKTVDGTPVEFDPGVATVEDLFVVDLQRRDQLLARAMAEMLPAWQEVDRMPRASRAVASVTGRVFSRLKRRLA